MISVVCFKWKPAPGYRSHYGPDQVNTLKRMVARNYEKPHRFICVTDDAEGLDSDVESVPLWDDYSDLPNPSFRGGPSCFRRLKVFSRDIGKVLGDRFVCLDLDIVITGDLTPLLDRTEPFISWRNPNPMWPINGSLFMMDSGYRPDVWEDFDPIESPRIANAAGCRGSDQGWMSFKLGRDLPSWSSADGVWSFQDELYRRGKYARPGQVALPRAARMVIFHGAIDPWSPQATRLAPWVKDHYK